jgi:ABC-2 type transport system ATP-binding protein
VSEVVEVHGLRLAYGSVVVLEDIDLTVTEGEIVALTGVNGVGKSTLLSCLAGFRPPAEGAVTVLGGPPRDNAEFWRAVAIVAEQPTWYPGLTVRELLELVRMTHRSRGGWCLPAGELIEIFGLSARADASPLSLSSGQRQRLSLAAALARPSQLLLLDEPEQSLDAGFRQELATLLGQEYAGNGGTVVMATHDHEFAVAAGARIIELSDGRVVDSDAYGDGDGEYEDPDEYGEDPADAPDDEYDDDPAGVPGAADTPGPADAPGAGQRDR